MLRALLNILFRSRLWALLAGCVILVALSTWLAYLFGGRQPVTGALDVGISVLRLVMPFLVVFWAQDLVHREFERKFYCVSLAYPLSRSRWILGRFLALLLVTIFSLAAVSACLALLVELFARLHSGQMTTVSLGWPYVLTMLLLTIDLVVILSVAMLLSVVASTPSFVLVGTLGFALIARSYSAIVALLSSSVGLVGQEDIYQVGLGSLGYLLPDLGGLDVRMIALYGRMEFLPTHWSWLALSSAAYAVGFLGLAMWALQRKRFA